MPLLRFSLGQAQLGLTVPPMRPFWRAPPTQLQMSPMRRVRWPASLDVSLSCLRGARISMRYTQQRVRTRLATSLKLASDALQANIRQLESTGAHPLLIATRKKELAKMQARSLSYVSKQGKAPPERPRQLKASYMPDARTETPDFKNHPARRWSARTGSLQAARIK